MSSRSNHGSRPNDPTGDVPAPTLRALLRAVHDAEVLSVAFPRLQRALVIAPRPGVPDYPAVLVATLGFGAGGQAAAVEKLRPGRPPSARSVAVTWGGSTRAFVEQGVAAFEELQEAEREEAPALARERTSFNEKLDG